MNIRSCSIFNIFNTLLIVLFTRKELFVESQVIPYKIYKQNITPPNFNTSRYLNTNQSPMNIPPNRVLVNSRSVNPVVQYLDPKVYNRIENIKTVYHRPAQQLISNIPVYTTRNIVPQVPIPQITSHVAYSTAIPEIYIPQKRFPVVYTTQNLIPEISIPQSNPPVRYPDMETIVIENRSPVIEDKKGYPQQNFKKRINGIEVNEIYSSVISSSNKNVKKKTKKVKNKHELKKEIEDIKKEIKDTIEKEAITNEKIEAYREEDDSNDINKYKEIEVTETSPVKINEKLEDVKKILDHTEILPEKKVDCVPIISTLIKETLPVTITKTETIQTPPKEIVTSKNTNEVVTTEVKNNSTLPVNMSDVYKNRLQAINSINNVNSCTENIEKNMKSISILKSCEQNILNNEIQINEAILKNKPTINSNILTDPRISDTQLNDLMSNSTPSMSPMVPIYQYESENSKLLTPYYDLNPIIRNENLYDPVVEIQQIHTVYETIRHHKPVHERHIPRTVAYNYKPNDIVIDNRETKPPKFLDVAKPKKRRRVDYFHKPLFLKDNDSSKEDDKSSKNNKEYKKNEMKNKGESEPSVEIEKNISRPEKSIQQSNKNTETPTKTITIYESVYKKKLEDENKTDIENVKTTTLYQLVPDSYKVINNLDILEKSINDIPKTVSIDTLKINKSIEKNINHTQSVKNMLGRLKSKQKEGFGDLMDELQDIKSYLNRQLENKILMIESKINEASYQNEAVVDKLIRNTNNGKDTETKSKENVIHEQHNELSNNEKSRDFQSSRQQEKNHEVGEVTQSATNEQFYNKNGKDTISSLTKKEGNENKEEISTKNIQENKKEDLMKNKDLKIIDIAKTNTKSTSLSNETPKITENLISKNLIASSEKEKAPAATKEDTIIRYKDIIRELNNMKEHINEYQLLKSHLKSFMIEYKSNNSLSDTRITELENLINSVVIKVDELTEKYNNTNGELKTSTPSDSSFALPSKEKESEFENKEGVEIRKDERTQDVSNVEIHESSEEVKAYVIPKISANRTIKSNSLSKTDIPSKDGNTLTPSKTKKIAIVYKNTIDEGNKYEDEHKTISMSDPSGKVEKLNKDEKIDNDSIKHTEKSSLIKKVISGKYKKVKNTKDDPSVVKNKVKKIIQGKYKKIKKKQVAGNFIDSLKKLVF